MCIENQKCELKINHIYVLKISVLKIRHAYSESHTRASARMSVRAHARMIHTHITRGMQGGTGWQQTHGHVRAHTYTHTYIHTHTHSHTCIWGGTGLQQLNEHVCSQTYTHRHTHRHTDIHTHTYTHTHTATLVYGGVLDCSS